MKNNCQFITAKFNRCDQFSDLGMICYRIITNKEVYFFYRNQFIDVKVLDELKKDDVIHIGSHELDDGTYWLHWLVSSKGDLAIKDKFNYDMPYRLMLIMLVLAFLGLLFVWLNIDIISLILNGFLFLMIARYICLNLFNLINLFLPKQIFLRKQYFRLKGGDLGFMKNSLLEKRQPLCCAVTDLPVYKGIATNVTSKMKKSSTSSSSSIKKVNVWQEISFNFNASSFTIKESSLVLSNFLVPVIYNINHPTFIAPKDRLSLVLEKNKIRGIVNHSDGSSYLITHCVWISKRKAKTLLRYWYFEPNLNISLLFVLIYFIFVDCSILSGFILLGVIGLKIVYPPLALLIYSLIAYFNDRSYSKRVLKWLCETTGHWPKEI